MSTKRVLSVGQCFADHRGITFTLRTHFEDVDVTGADSSAEALEKLRGGSFDLVLVNRVLDADGSSGMEIVRQIKADAQLSAVPVMLVSNYDDAQQEAIKLGALAGFGKASLGQPVMLGRIRNVLGG